MWLAFPLVLVVDRGFRPEEEGLKTYDLEGAVHALPFSFSYVMCVLVPPRLRNRSLARLCFGLAFCIRFPLRFRIAIRTLLSFRSEWRYGAKVSLAVHGRVFNGKLANRAADKKNLGRSLRARRHVASDRLTSTSGLHSQVLPALNSQADADWNRAHLHKYRDQVSYTQLCRLLRVGREGAPRSPALTATRSSRAKRSVSLIIHGGPGPLTCTGAAFADARLGSVVQSSSALPAVRREEDPRLVIAS